MATQHAAPSADAHAESPPKSKKLIKLIALVFMVAVVVGECLATFIFLSGTKEQTATAGTTEHEETATDEHASDADSHSDEEPAHDAPAGHEETSHHGGHGDAEPVVHRTGDREVDLGQYSLTAYQPSSDSTVLVDFHLYATVAPSNEETFNRAFEAHKHRFREQVIVIIRSSEASDFADPGLGLIKRLILEKSNNLLGKPFLRSIVFSEFTFIEQ